MLQAPQPLLPDQSRATTRSGGRAPVASSHIKRGTPVSEPTLLPRNAGSQPRDLWGAHEAGTRTHALAESSLIVSLLRSVPHALPPHSMPGSYDPGHPLPARPSNHHAVTAADSPVGVISSPGLHHDSGLAAGAWDTSVSSLSQASQHALRPSTTPLSWRHGLSSGRSGRGQGPSPSSTCTCVCII